MAEFDHGLLHPGPPRQPRDVYKLKRGTSTSVGESSQQCQLKLAHPKFHI
jgi:hypothetical protein